MVLLIAPEKRSRTPSLSSTRSTESIQSPESPLLPSHTHVREKRRVGVKKYVVLNMAIVSIFGMMWLVWRWNELHERDRWQGGMGRGRGPGPGPGWGHGPHGGKGPGKSKVDRLSWKQAWYERLLLSIPDPESAQNTSRALAAEAHLAGSAGDYASALRMLAFFQESFNVSNGTGETQLPIYKAGSPESRNAVLNLSEQAAPSAWIDTYFPLLNTPAAPPVVQLLGPSGEAVWEAQGEPDCGGIPAFHGLSRGGDVSAALVFAGEAMPADFERLRAQGVSVQGKVVLAQYGGNYRGMKVQAAADAGAAAVLLLSSPVEDGPVTEANGYAAYPAGPARNARAVQRGSVQALSVYPGDPGTPGRPAYEGVSRDWELAGNASEGWGTGNLPGIPSVPVNWADGERLLEAARRGARVRVVNSVDTKVTPVWNVMAAIPGYIKDEVVVIGNHRDAWVKGAADPVSGTVAVHEVVRAFAALREHNWTPARTVIFASWDAEEYSLVGSTEWGEDFGEWIGGRVVAYLNLDMAVSGSQWTAWGSPSLAHLIRRTAQDVPHPTEAGKTLWDARADEGPFALPVSNITRPDHARDEPEDDEAGTGVLPLGSGSDYTVFLQHLGVASTDQGFIHTPTDAVFHYHSCLDDETWQETYVDTGFHRHVAVAKHLGLMALRLADAVVLPLNTTQYARELHTYLDGVEDLLTPSLALTHLPDFARLRGAISQLVATSVELDEEKGEANEHFRGLLDALMHGHPRHEDPWHQVKHAIAHWARVLFCIGGCGEEARRAHEQWQRDRMTRSSGYWMDVAFHSDDVEEGVDAHAKRIKALAVLRPAKANGTGQGGHQEEHGDNDTHSDLVRRFIRAAKRVRRTNRKLVQFESGFLDEAGLKGREWYKHLGVAPGYWLGYGATTLPGLTEALTLERNVTLAEYEANRLAERIEKMVVHLRP